MPIGRKLHLLLQTLAVLCLVMAAGRQLSAQISPGPLSKAHSSLSGLTQCTSCHRFATAGGGLKCLECHSEIQQRLSTNLGLHAAVVKHENPEKDCVRCHSEHHGEDFALVRWEPSRERFDHGRTGYVLTGKHAVASCQACHTAAHVQAEWKQRIKIRDMNRTFLGLSQDCVSCHQDFHRGELGQDCKSCHNTSDWKEAAHFDHAKTRFPLTGLHTRIACARCHTPATAGGPPRFTGLRFASCAACHNDPHRGAFQKECAACHSTAGWKVLTGAGLSAEFDHSKTAFPLLGQHRTVDCSSCHRSGDFRAKVPHASCSDCHQPDPHGGQFSQRKDGGRCEACHAVEGWKPANFTVQEHAATAYPLQGKHADVACAKCHIPAGRATRYKVPFARCLDCHSDQHAGQFAAAPYFNRCENCHTVKSYQPSTFTLEKHQRTRFHLDGAHLAVPCTECHAALPGRPRAEARFRYAALVCTTCHEDVHRGEFKTWMDRKRPDGRLAGCEACHSVNDWHDLTNFDHDQTAYPLIGTHKGVACIDCHKPPNLETTLRHVSFKDAPQVCASCHEDPHARQFAREGKDPGCEQCHRPLQWRPSLFDHETSAFSLKGAHQQVACKSCHTNLQDVSGKQVLFYAPTPKQCEACHGAQVPKQSLNLLPRA